MSEPTDLTDVEPAAGPLAVRVSVSGEVQGVGYRWYAGREAERLGLVGWVRNEADGSVSAHLEGSREAVDAMVEWCRTGSPAARVRDVTTRDAEPHHPASFEIRS